MNTQLIIPVSIIMGTIVVAFILNRYAMPKLNQLNLNEALVILTLPHAFRYIGLAFLVEGTTAVALDTRFAHPAAYGDFLAAILAFIAIVALSSNWRSSKILIWIFSIVGSVDFIYAIISGLSLNRAETFGATIFIPMAIVPGLLVAQFLIFKLLLTETK